ncbi:MAG: hypothetical protein ABI604_19585 [Nitrospirota bacterium]
MPNLVRLASIPQAAGQLLGDPQLVIQGLDQDDTPIWTGMGLVKSSHHRLQFFMELKRHLR